MKTKIVSCVGLVVAVASVCLAQTPSPTSAKSSWQLAPPFEVRSSLPSPSPAVSSSPVPTSTNPSAILQTNPTQSSESAPAQTTRGRESSRNKMPYVEGSAWVLTFIKTKSGLTDDYFKSITSSLKPLYDEEKKQKLILDYKILSSESAGDRDFNIILMVEYPNMAALERVRETTEPIVDKIIGPTDTRRDLAAKRLDLREILATKTMREIWLK